MAKIPGSIPVTGFIAPTDSSDIYAVTDETYARGGYRTVEDANELNSIPADRKKEGMLVYVKGEDKFYQLKNDVFVERVMGASSTTYGDGLIKEGDNVKVDNTVIAEKQYVDDELLKKQDVITTDENLHIFDSRITVDTTKIATKQYVDFQLDKKAWLGEDNVFTNTSNDFTQSSVLVKTPTEDSEPATKKYVDEKTNAGTGNFDILNVTSGSVSKVTADDTSLTNKKYVDDAIKNIDVKGVAKVDELNTFSKKNTFRRIEIDDSDIITENPDDGTQITTPYEFGDKEAVHKKYVDTADNKIQTSLDDYKLEVTEKLNEKVNKNEIHSLDDLNALFDKKTDKTYAEAAYVKVANLDALIAHKADTATTYTKDEVDEKLRTIDLNGYYDKVEVDKKLLLKVDKTTLEADYTDNTKLEEKLGLKADQSALEQAIQQRLADYKKLTDDIVAAETKIDENYTTMKETANQMKADVVAQVEQVENEVQTVSTTLTGEMTKLTESVTTVKDELQGKITTNTDAIAAINGKIPATVTAQNPLVDKNTLTEMITQNSANPISADVNGSPFASYAALIAGPWYSMGQAVDAPSKNDYALVKSDENHNGNSVRYNYNGAGWTFFQEFKDSNFDATQMAAINSGATAELIGKITTTETKLNDALDAHKTDRDQLKKDLADEINARTQADTTLTTNLAAEETKRLEGDDALSTELDTLRKTSAEERAAIKKTISDNKVDIETKVGGLEALTTTNKTSIVSAINSLNDELDNDRVHKSGDIMTGSLRVQLPASGVIFEMKGGDKGLEFQMDAEKGYLHLVPASNQDLGFIYTALNFLPRQTTIPTSLGLETNKWTNAWVENVNGISTKLFGVRDDTALNTDDTKVWSAKRTYQEIKDNQRVISVTEDEYNVMVEGGKIENNTIYLIRTEDYATEDKTELAKQVLNMVWPVGSVYVTLSDAFDPSAQFGGTWEKISSGKYLKAVESGAGVEIGAGLPNIVGQFVATFVKSVSGAFIGSPASHNWRGTTDTTQATVDVVGFNASNSNSIYGNSTTVTPESITVIMWKRTA